MKLGTLPILKGTFMNLIFGDGAMKQMCSGSSPSETKLPAKNTSCGLFTSIASNLFVP